MKRRDFVKTTALAALSASLPLSMLASRDDIPDVFKLKRGDIGIICGSAGTGKTILLNHIKKLIPNYKLVDDIHMRNITLNEFAINDYTTHTREMLRTIQRAAYENNTACWITYQLARNATANGFPAGQVETLPLIAKAPTSILYTASTIIQVYRVHRVKFTKPHNDVYRLEYSIRKSRYVDVTYDTDYIQIY